MRKSLEIIPVGDCVYNTGGMPLGLYAPSFCIQETANALNRCIETLEHKRQQIQDYKFISWSSICDEWLEDILTLSVNPATI
jgi:hypothetical protein